MSWRWLAFAVIAVAAAVWMWKRDYGRSDVVNYRRQKIKLSKSDRDFDTYKNDHNNIDPSETARVQGLVVDAPIGRSFAKRIDVFQATQQVVFPGYGASSGESVQSNGSKLLAVAVEIPRAEKDRYLVFRQRDGHYELVDDFVNVDIPVPFTLREENGSYVYCSGAGKQVFQRPHGRTAMQ